MPNGDDSIVDESLKRKVMAPRILSSRKINKTNNNNHAIQYTKRRSVEIELYALENRVKVEEEIFFKDVLDAIPDIDNLKIFLSEMKSQISDININSSKINEELEFFSEFYLQEIEAKIAGIASQRE